MTVFSIHSSITGNRDQHQMIIPAYLLTAVLFFSCLSSKAQDKGKDAEAEKTIKASENLTYEANKQLAGDDFEDAEVSYRKAIAKNPENATAKYNLGNAYYRREDLGEAFSRYKQAGETATDQAAKHRAYHNLGNVFMKNKEYQKAVEAYKEALRNDPTDEETRYNLALAKEMLEKNPPQNNDDNKDDKNQDQNKDKDQQDQDKQDQNQGGEDNKDQDQKDQGDQGDKGDQPEDNKDKGNDDKGGQDQKDQGEDGQPEDGEGQPQPGQSELSPQQIQALLEAMGREEKRVQDKINAKKAKGAKTSTEKDW
ncbi:Tetratricopeptide repeat-containing protein [Sinomicrobium oceani]|uniref:Tetratricopeptide repeat-containing protein n=1 Tax=Sinomicrobium oceani TaxID=1150368 RepID=A0A1K1P634_9FLAO|nr:tetratricopeptide repeat protein [Sinomicrobium oceani]SFW42909.1 Tetratricopeptide repeat-containing protein [Sinomicrobium oceani]